MSISVLPLTANNPQHLKIQLFTKPHPRQGHTSRTLTRYHNDFIAGTQTALANDILISSVFNSPFTDGVLKGVEITALAKIAKLSRYVLASINNGGDSDDVTAFLA